MSAGKYQRFSHTVRTASGQLVTHDFLVRAHAATDSAALAVIPRLASVLAVPTPTEPAQIAANVRHIKNCLTAYESVEPLADGTPWVRLRGIGCGAMLHAATTHYCGFDPRAAQVQP